MLVRVFSNIHVLHYVLSSFSLSLSLSFCLMFPVDEVMQIVQRLLNDSGGVVVGMATQEEFVTAIQAEQNVTESGCFINGSGEIHYNHSLLTSVLFYTIKYMLVVFKEKQRSQQ